MRRPIRKLAICLVATVLTACSAAREADRVEVDPQPSHASTSTVVGVRDDVREIAHANAVRRAQFGAAVQYAIAAENARLVAFLTAVKAEQDRKAREAARRPKITIGTATQARAGGHSDAWWHGVAICEQGGRNDSYYGYFSYMDGSAGGGKSWAEQVAMGNRTIAQYGDHAWAAKCVAAGYAAAPGG